MPTALSDRHRRFLWIEQGVVPTVFNLLLNGAIAWALFRGVAAVPLWGESSFGVDLLFTGFLLPFLSCVIVSALVGRDVRSGKVPPLPREQLPLSRWHQRTVLARGAYLGLLGLLLASVPIVTALHLAQAQPVPMASFVTFKAVWAAGVAAVIAPFVGWWALAHASRGSDGL